jgi:hypothetical protein
VAGVSLRQPPQQSKTTSPQSAPSSPAKPTHHKDKTMPRYLITFDDGSMNHISEQDFPAVGEAARAVVREAKEAGVQRRVSRVKKIAYFFLICSIVF